MCLAKCKDANLHPQGSSPCYVYPVWHLCELALLMECWDERIKVSPFPCGAVGTMDHGTMGGGTLHPRGSQRVLSCAPTGIISSVSPLTLQTAGCSSSIILDSPSSPLMRGDGARCVLVMQLMHREVSPGFSWPVSPGLEWCPVCEHESRRSVCIFL